MGSIDAIKQDEKLSSKTRLKAKLFGKEKKATSEGEMSDFLHGPSDKLYMNSPPREIQTNTQSQTAPREQLKRIDTSNARRWPTAAEINSHARKSPGLPVSKSPKQSRKGLNVRFTDRQPEVIGEGGDEAEQPTELVSARKRAASHPSEIPRQAAAYNNGSSSASPVGKRQAAFEQQKDFKPGPLRRTQTGFSKISDQAGEYQDIIPAMPMSPSTASPVSPVSDSSNTDNQASSASLRSEPSMSFAAKIQAEMRASEGEAFIRASRANIPEDIDFTAGDPEAVSPTAVATRMNTVLAISPVAEPQEPSPGGYFPTSSADWKPPNPSPPRRADPPTPDSPKPTLQKAPTWTLRDAASAVTEDALNDFTKRTEHLYTLFTPAAEALKPISSITLEELITASTWWFLKGRANLEVTIRERPSTPEAQRAHFRMRQQAYVDLSKSLWICQRLTPRHPEFQDLTGDSLNAFVEQSRNGGDINYADQLETHQAIVTSLRKLTMSMKRNNILPPGPGEAPLTQDIDTSIWVPYPAFTPDICALLSGNGSRSLVAGQPQSSLIISDAMPLGDTRRNFNFGRMFVDGYLMEEGIESQQFRCPCILSMTRGQRDKHLKIAVASQNGLIKLCVQSDKNRGPTWDNVTWRARSYAIEIQLPRGFVFKVVCSPQDFNMLWSIYDYTSKVQASLRAARDEEIIFEATTLSFQYFDKNPQSRAFPKEAVPRCRVRLLEKKLTIAEGTGARSMHRGFRIVVITSPGTKTLSGISHDVLPGKPIQFGFMRGDGGHPSLLLKIDDNERGPKTLVLTFTDPEERKQLHNLLTGVAVKDEETVYAETLLSSFSISSGVKDFSRACQQLDWQSIRVINIAEADVESAPVVLSEALRIIVNSHQGTVTDRVNVGPSEFRFQLSIDAPNTIKIHRQPQLDATIAISESQVAKTLPDEMTEVLKTISTSQSTRIYAFPNQQCLHQFQTAVTGYSVLFDGNATSFAISRRRMVVPIYKKWDATSTRLQIVRQERIVQLTAFFKGFAHGDCMNFTLKGTDVFENMTKSGKPCVRIVDAKFALPRGGELEKEKEKHGKETEGERAAFVCLDMPDYPSEHDDITITFDTEAERERFTQALPAAVKIGSRMGSIKR